MATYTWADNADGTGFTVTVASGGAQTHQLFAFTPNVDVGSWAWASQSSSVGDGVLTSSLVGFHWWYVSSSVDGPTVPTPNVSTNAADTTHMKCMDAVRSTITSLSLTDIDAGDIQILKIPLDRGWDEGTFDYPGIIISSIGTENISPSAGTNARDDIEYPVFVSMLAADNQDLQTNHNKYLKWRHSIAKAFRNQRLNGVDEVIICRVQPLPITSQAQWFNNVHHSSLVIRCIGRETRGV